MIDIHAHILPNVDDGCDSFSNAIMMLRQAEELGVTDVILTPHYRLDMFLTPWQKDREVFERLLKEKEKQNISVNLYLGQEVHYDKKMLSILKNGGALTLNDTKYLLLEFDFRQETDIQEEVYNYTRNGYKVIVAHYERYTYATIEEAYEIKSLGGEIQINAYTILGKEGKRSKKLARQLLKEGLVDYVASDVHLNKDNDLQKAYAFVKRRYGKKTARAVFFDNAKKIIKKD